MASCGGDDPAPPPEENEEEIITDVVLRFSPAGGGTVVTASAVDPDGQGTADIEIVNDVRLAAQTSYTLEITLENSVVGESISEEVKKEADEHQLFFAWTADAFEQPAGDGNIDNPGDPADYLDMDPNGLPLGLQTSWTTGGPLSNGSFRIVLKHQPDLKTSTSSAQTGDSDVDLTWTLVIE